MYLKIKPLSVNEAWQGRRFKTQKYKDYEKELWAILPKIKISKEKLQLTMLVGCPIQSDLDNFLKPFLDVLQKKYGFNDKQIYSLHARKEAVEKGDEFIVFFLESL